MWEWFIYMYIIYSQYYFLPIQCSRISLCIQINNCMVAVIRRYVGGLSAVFSLWYSWYWSRNSLQQERWRSFHTTSNPACPTLSHLLYMPLYLSYHTANVNLVFQKQNLSKQTPIMSHFRLPRPVLLWDFTQHRMVILIDVWGQPILFSFLDFLTVEDGTNRLSWNVGQEMPLYAA